MRFPPSPHSRHCFHTPDSQLMYEKQSLFFIHGLLAHAVN